MSAPIEAELTSNIIKTNGINLHVTQAGSAQGPLVILLHGFPEYWRGWIKQIKPLAEAGFWVWAPDQRGYNLSDKPAGISAYPVEELARDVIGLIDAAGQEKCFLAGHDWGAAVAWETAMRWPERVQKLAILNVPNPDVMRRFLFSRPNQVLKSWYIFFFQLPFLPEWGLRQNNFAGLKRALAASGKPGSFSSEDIQGYIQAWNQPGALTSMLNWYRAAFRAGLRGPRQPARIKARGVNVPTLILWGKQDIALSWEMAQPSCDLCQQGELVFFENASHWVQHDEPLKITRHLLEFFKQ
jgi:pimeloyl-ACP methyl ester carboxylesterase